MKQKQNNSTTAACFQSATFKIDVGLQIFSIESTPVQDLLHYALRATVKEIRDSTLYTFEFYSFQMYNCLFLIANINNDY